MGLTVVTGGPVAPPSIGGAEGTGGSYPEARVREAGPPPSVVTFTSFRQYHPDPEGRVYDVEANDDKQDPVRSSGSQLQGKIVTIFATDAPRGDYEAPGGGPSGFPPHVENFGPSHRSVVIEPTASGQHR